MTTICKRGRMPDDHAKPGNASDQVPGASTLRHRAPAGRPHRRSTFRPSARLILTDRVRTSGLWRALTPEDFKTLVLLLTFVTPNGWCRPTLPELADAMGTSPAPKPRAAWTGCCRRSGRGSRWPSCCARPDGLDAYLPGRRLVAHEDVAGAGAAPGRARCARRAGRR